MLAGCCPGTNGREAPPQSAYLPTNLGYRNVSSLLPRRSDPTDKPATGMPHPYSHSTLTPSVRAARHSLVEKIRSERARFENLFEFRLWPMPMRSERSCRLPATRLVAPLRCAASASGMQAGVRASQCHLILFGSTSNSKPKQILKPPEDEIQAHAQKARRILNDTRLLVENGRSLAIVEDMRN